SSHFLLLNQVRDPRTTVHGEVAVQTGVRRSLQDVCQSPLASAVTESRNTWTTVNIPKEQSLGRKVCKGLGGIGLSSLQIDDPKGKCGAGPYPSHSLVLLKCRNRDYHRLPSAQCTRLCYLDESAEDFNPQLLEPHWCSHIVRRNRAAAARNCYIACVKAKNSLPQTVRAMNVSGVDISWTREPLDSIMDTTYLSQFLTDLRTVLPRVNKTNCKSALSFEFPCRTAEFVILQTHRLHSPNLPTTGHHSAMFSAPGLTDNRMTVESFVRDWVSRGVTSGPAGQILGLPTAKGSTSIEPMSQTEVGLKSENNATEWMSHWLNGISAPVLMRGTDFVAYDNEKSARIKATWSSSNNLAGMAIHGLPYDNPEGECPDRAFPILQSIVDAQVSRLAARFDNNCSMTKAIARID
ncbi:unnamed protein product, partial [Cylicostephanus goldi]